MSDLLSNEEIESLMEMVNSDAAEFDSPVMMQEMAVDVASSLAAAISPVDLLTPNRISKVQLDRFERVLHAAAESIGTTMSEQLGCEVHCDCVAVDQTRFANWAPVAVDGSACYLLDAPPLDIPLMFTATKELLYGWADRVLGGQGVVNDVPTDFTDVEFAVFDTFLAPVFAGVASALRDLVDIEVSVEDRFTNPARIHLLPAQDIVLSGHFQVGSDQFVGDLRLGFAFSALEPFLGAVVKPLERYKQQPGRLRDQLSSKVKPVGLDFSVELGRSSMTLRELMQLRVGDVVSVDRSEGDPMIAPVAGVPKFAGRVGTVGSRLGFQVASLLE